MKLTDFKNFAPLVNLKTKMGIPRDKLGTLRGITLNPHKVSSTEKKNLVEGGVEVSIDDVGISADGTLVYKDQRVLLYIRDVANYLNRDADPRFHFSNCTTLRDMRQKNRFGKYVVANRTDGEFVLNYITTGRRVEKKLSVCQNCLDYLSYDGFNLSNSRERRYAAVGRFSCSEFFERYPKNLHHQDAKHSAATAPKNDYSTDWQSISRSYRAKVKWRCSKCTMELSTTDLQRFLHVHHLNGMKNENHETNLRALCVKCHAEEPDHSHVRFTLQYKEFMSRFG